MTRQDQTVHFRLTDAMRIMDLFCARNSGVYIFGHFKGAMIGIVTMYETSLIAIHFGYAKLGRLPRLRLVSQSQLQKRKQTMRSNRLQRTASRAVN